MVQETMPVNEEELVIERGADMEDFEVGEFNGSYFRYGEAENGFFAIEWGTVTEHKGEYYWRSSGSYSTFGVKGAEDLIEGMEEYVSKKE